METYIGILKRMTKGIKGDVAKAFYLGKVLHNQQAGTAALALVQHEQEYLKLRDELNKIGADKLDRDYGTAQAGLSLPIEQRDAKLKALEQRLGEGFSWTVPVENTLLGGVVGGLGWMLDKFPVVTKLALGFAGGVLALVAALGTLVSLEKVLGPEFLGIGKAITFLRGSLGLLLGIVRWFGAALFDIGTGPVGWALALAGAALLIWQNWGEVAGFFRWLWQKVEGGFSNFVAWVDGWTGGMMTAAIGRIKEAWSGLKSFFSTLWADISAPFEHFLADVEAGIAQLRSMLGTGPRNPSPNDVGGGRSNPTENGPAQYDGNPFLFPGAYHPAGGGRVGFDPIEVKVTVDGPGKAEAPRWLQPNRGEMLGRA